jgi:RNA polymerase sigma factor (sigma-70 family)
MKQKRTHVQDRERSLELLRRARSGDREALEQLFCRYRPVLRRWARGRLPGWARELADTDDLVQDTLLQTVKKIEVFQPSQDHTLLDYLRMALRNRIVDEIRRRGRRPERTEIDDQVEDDTASPLERSVELQNLERYDAALAKLAVEDRELIVLRLEMGLSYEELAEVCGKPSANAARMAVLRALLRLGKEIEREN